MTLSQRIAALEGPDRAIDAEINAVVDNRPDADFFPAPEYTASIDTALSIVQPSMQAHVMHEAMKLLGPRGEIVGKFTEQLACAICEVALKERGL